MKKEGSTTAQVTAFGRAYHHMFDRNKIFDDPLAKNMLTQEQFEYVGNKLASYIGLIDPIKQFKFKREEGGALRRMIHRLVNPAPLARSKYTEDFLMDAIGQGVEQYVIMGAGFDTFAFRKPELLDKLTVFEVDHPSTQVHKTERIKELGWEIHPNHRFAGIDFETDIFEEKLLEAGFDKSKKTLFCWLGVTYYLTKEAIKTTLRDIENVSPRGSFVVFDYPDKEFYSFFRTTLRVKIMVKLVKGVNEPMRVGYSHEEIEGELKGLGYKIHEHLSRGDIQERFFKHRKDDYSAFENINIICAITD